MNAAPEYLNSACPHDCPSTCALEVERLAPDRIGKVRGARANSYTAGVICSKVARYAERIHHPARLLQPVRRSGAKGSGAFAVIDWEAALDEVAEALLEAEQRHGAETVWPYFYAGTMGLVMRDGINRLRHAKRYSGEHATICTTLAWNGYLAGTGRMSGVDPREMAAADVVVIWGTNAAATQINVMTHALRARRERGARLVVIDTYRNATAEQADLFLCVRPGTDGALACAVMHVLFRDELADWDYLERYTDCPRELAAHLRDRDPAWASAICGVPAADIEAFARLLGTHPHSYFRLGYGFARQRNGAVNMHAAASIPAVLGAWRHPGGGALHNNGAIYHWDRTLIDGLDVRDPQVRLLDQSRIGAVLNGERAALGDGPPVTALFIQNTNPMSVAPDLNQVARGFARRDLFTCVHEQFMTETARIADIVLPATMFLEHDDMYRGGGHVYLTVTKKIVEPFAECRSNNDVICELGRRLGSKHSGFYMTAWELIDDSLRRSGHPGADEVYEKGGIDCSKPFEDMHFLSGFKHPDGKFHFAPDWAKLGPAHAAMPTLPDHLTNIDDATPERPFRLVAAPARRFLNTTFTETPTSRKKEGRPTALIHPDDCRRLGVDEGDRVRMGNDLASVVVHARPFDGLQPGVVVVESIWPNAAFEEGLGINALVRADAAPPGGGAVFHDTSVWLRAEP